MSSESDITSSSGNDSSTYDDNSEFNDNPTREALLEGMISFIRPTVEEVNEQVKKTKESQEVLESMLDETIKQLYSLVDTETISPAEMLELSALLTAIKDKIYVSNNVLQSVKERLSLISSKLNTYNINKDKSEDSSS